MGKLTAAIAAYQEAFGGIKATLTGEETRQADCIVDPTPSSLTVSLLSLNHLLASPMTGHMARMVSLHCVI